MTGQALYRKWRSQTFAQVIAQEHVTRTLQNAIRAGRIGHAYLFCGPRGTGKTSTARILAKAVNCLAEPAERPCDACARCRAVAEGRDLDLIEIDAASNRGIDEIRDLRDKVAFAPNEGRFKVYVIDEVHMLTNEAFNALLKTLEEPPPHVIFILATTEAHKVPATIASRCQRFDFRRAPVVDLMAKLQMICREEGIRAEPAALEAVARRAAGSFRDAESLLDQLAAACAEEISLAQVQSLLGAVGTGAVADLVDALIAADLGQGLRLINRLVDEGVEPRQIHLELVDYLRILLLLHSGADADADGVTAEQAGRMRRQLAGLGLARLVEALRLFGQSEGVARGEVRAQLPLELAFAQAVLLAKGEERLQTTPGPVMTAPPCQAMGQPAGRPPARAATTVGERPPRQAQQGETEHTRTDSPRSSGTGPGTGVLQARWADVLEAVRAQDRMFQAVLRSVRPIEVADGRALLEAEGSFHRDRTMEDKNRRLLEAVLEKVLGAPCRVECTL
ncbi:MAG: DNA polymerase III subunit gamma/tau, partial [Anaerolineae bacterium]